MRLSNFLSALSVFCAAVLCFAAPAAAQVGNPADECARGIHDACWIIRFGTCAHENPRVAIPACTRRLAAEFRFFRADNVVGGSKRADQAQYYALRGNAHFKQGNIDRALDDYRLAIKSFRGVYWIHANQGSTLFEKGDYQGALSSFDRALELAPGNSIFLNARARLLAAAPDAAIRDGARALRDSQTAIGLLERVPPIFFDTLAAAHAEAGNFAEAVQIEQSAIDGLPPDAQGTIAEYRGRLELYRRNMPFRMEPRSGS